ncbi:CocE/NonD family hydrolase [Nocardia arthritidis]|uniref:CocE/NonD family hydrolase n=1 Tax=Nocardia arthritidis TaxID=228602 RepID=A0A6G9YCG0_9NOCA|nr:CocE/NonD family hydrolase [Nocardia arthritidis]QIS10911.1 CocE/NonD family hydrolase [Nocardia arthritidis]
MRNSVISRCVDLLVPLLVSGFLAAPPATATPEGEPDWTAEHDGPQRYPSIHIDWDIPITMSDGTVLKANVYRPADANGPITTPLPTIVNVTPYTKLVTMIGQTAASIPILSDAVINFFRDFQLDGTPLEGLTDATRFLGGGFARTALVDPVLVRSGYTQIVVDTRGTGFSQGFWEPWGPTEQRDTPEIIAWAAAQPWSDGNIGMSGASYSGVNQLEAAEKRPPALKAIVPVISGSDVVRNAIAPGGAAIGLLLPYVIQVNLLKLTPDMVSIALGRLDSKWLADRLASPMSFLDVVLQTLTTTSFDAIPPQLAEVLNPDSPLRKAWEGHPERITVPTMVIGGWHDNFADGEPRVYRDIPLPPGQKQLIMGNSYHITVGFDMRGKPGEPPRMDVLQRAWFDKWLKGIDNGIDRYGPITMWQQGGGWTTADQFPRPEATHRRMYFSATASGTATSVFDGSLTTEPNQDSASLAVAPGLATFCSADAEQGTVGMLVFTGCGKDARIAERDALTFTSAPVTGPTTLSGPIDIHLNTVLDATDGYWAVTVNDVAPDGRSATLSTGQLLASLRAIDESRSARSENGDLTDPYPILSLDSRQPVTPGEPTTVDIGIAPTDAILQPGHRLRVDIFASNLPKGVPIRPFLDATELKPQHLQLDPAAPSYVNVPLAGDPGW